PTAVVAIVSLMDTLVVVGVFALARRLGTVAIWAALLYAVLPLVYRAFVYGVLPTIFAQMLAIFVVLVPTLWPEKLQRVLPFVGWVLLLTLSLLPFPTELAFNSLVLVVAGLIWVWRRATPGGTLLRLSAGLAIALA